MLTRPRTMCRYNWLPVWQPFYWLYTALHEIMYTVYKNVYNGVKVEWYYLFKM